MWLMMETKSNAIKNNTTQEPRTLSPRIKVNWKVVKQEMARVNIDILGISKLKWTGMGEFDSDDHFIDYCEQEFLRRNGVALIVN